MVKCIFGRRTELCNGTKMQSPYLFAALVLLRETLALYDEGTSREVRNKEQVRKLLCSLILRLLSSFRPFRIYIADFLKSVASRGNFFHLYLDPSFLKFWILAPTHLFFLNGCWIPLSKQPKFQKPPATQDKLPEVLKGSVFYKNWLHVKLSFLSVSWEMSPSMAGTKMEQVHADLLLCLKSEMCFVMQQEVLWQAWMCPTTSTRWKRKGMYPTLSWRIGYQNFLFLILSKGKER